MKYKKVLIKLSGETLNTNKDGLFSNDALSTITSSIKELLAANIKVCIVIGGGNICRGRSLSVTSPISRISSDKIGMLATCMNGLALSDFLNRHDCPAILMNSFNCHPIAQSYSSDTAKEAMTNNVLILSGGLSVPYLSTDTTAAIRASELNVDIILKATSHVDGVFDKDPLLDSSAKLFSKLTFAEVIKLRLQIMDFSAMELCLQNNISIKCFCFPKNTFLKALNSEIGTIIEKQ